MPMNSISFFVPGVPVSTQYRQTKSGVVYKSANGKQWEKSISLAAKAEAGPGFKPFEGSVNLILDFHFPIPKSRKELKPGDVHLQDPDSTNLLKNTEDGLKRILFLDDNTVQIGGVHKWWCKPGEEGVQITVIFT